MDLRKENKWYMIWYQGIRSWKAFNSIKNMKVSSSSVWATLFTCCSLFFVPRFLLGKWSLLQLSLPVINNSKSESSKPSGRTPYSSNCGVSTITAHDTHILGNHLKLQNKLISICVNLSYISYLHCCHAEHYRILYIPGICHEVLEMNCFIH